MVSLSQLNDKLTYVEKRLDEYKAELVALRDVEVRGVRDRKHNLDELVHECLNKITIIEHDLKKIEEDIGRLQSEDKKLGNKLIIFNAKVTSCLFLGSAIFAFAVFVANQWFKWF